MYFRDSKNIKNYPYALLDTLVNICCHFVNLLKIGFFEKMWFFKFLVGQYMLTKLVAGAFDVGTSPIRRSKHIFNMVNTCWPIYRKNQKMVIFESKNSENSIFENLPRGQHLSTVVNTYMKVSNNTISIQE